MNYLRNTWYAAAWSDEVNRTPLARDLLEMPVVMFRELDGTAVAIGDRCSHRFAPLSQGTLEGDSIQCPYHGLRYGGTGACVHNPHGDGKIPKAARVPSYIIEERHGLIWLWAGEPEKIDSTLIPDLAHLENPMLGKVRGYMTMKAHYQLGIDNLIDLSHTQFVHGDILGSDNYHSSNVEVVHDGDTVLVKLSIPNSDVPPIYHRHVSNPQDKVDYWLDAVWSPPAMVINDIGISAPGAPRDSGIRSKGLHLLTPASERSAHYFFAHSRNTKISDPDFDEQIREWHRVGFGQQDKPIIESSAAMMGNEVDPMKLGAVLLPTDGGALRSRRILAKLIDAERDGVVEQKL